ncbi:MULTISPECIES: hypothetical protein [Bradyrhizobium]|uniref:hypothetical protein n=1 Tax=Bradyrhizobium TaxID=374 RepID=UPI001EDA2B8F|nr:hypothetical protein [Bradyrhizobium zhengyangense]MCG2645740.1 hypothetical protein [Bradyrhizobium zhengyangense]
MGDDELLMSHGRQLKARKAPNSIGAFWAGLLIDWIWVGSVRGVSEIMANKLNHRKEIIARQLRELNELQKRVDDAAARSRAKHSTASSRRPPKWHKFARFHTLTRDT